MGPYGSGRAPFNKKMALTENGGDGGTKFDPQTLSSFLRNDYRFLKCGRYLHRFALRKDAGGSGEIRTPEGRKPLLVFKTSAFNHSATLPQTACFSSNL